MIERFGDFLEIPLRDRNQVLLAAGYAPAHAESSIDAPEMAPVREALDQVLAGHEPFPAVVIDRRWNLVAANQAVNLFLDGIDPALLEPPVNVLRLSFHPDGLASRTVNLAEFRARLLGLVERQVVLTADRELTALLAELRGYPVPDDDVPEESPANAVFVPMRLRHGDRVLSFFNTLTTFGTPLDVTVAELCVESFFPADRETADLLRTLGERNSDE